MDIIGEVCEKGVVERRFDLKVGDEIVPGIIWSPEGAATPRPTVLLGHGGSSEKRTPYILGLARRLVRHLGYVAVAVDAPGHGERTTAENTAKMRARIEQRMRDRETMTNLSGDEARAWVDPIRGGVSEWKATLDDIEQLDIVDDSKVGYWGLSMGTAIGLPFVSSEPRIKAAVLGLAGLGNRPGGDGFERAARSLTIPILFIFQWDDQLMTRESGIALFDAIGSLEKTMHLNPGGHVGTPLFERDAYEAFYARHLGSAA